MEEDGDVTFKPELLQKILQNKTDFTAKPPRDAMVLLAEYVRLFVIEGGKRAISKAKAEQDSEVQAHHLEKILPQLLLDF
eukprot:m.235607 g.235607  ORF g.235607 m.235607 type:complete len:80 (-) comp26534_c2_seq11:173-412(-)